MNFLNTVKGKISGFFKSIKKGWKNGWSKLESVSSPLHDIYEVRDFKGFSAYGIGFAILAIFFGFFVLAIRPDMRIEVGANLFRDIGEVFNLIALICMIAGIVTTTDAGILFIGAAYLLPFVGELATIVQKLITGQIAAYMAANWISLVLFAVIAILPLLTYFKVLPVKLHRWIFPAAMLVFLAYAVITIVNGWYPFYNDAGVLSFSDICEFFTFVLSYAFITITIFGAHDKINTPITVVKLKDKEEEF